MTVTILILGFLFGAAIQYANLNKYDVISGLAVGENFTVAKAMILAIGIGVVLLNIEIALGGASYHVKPFLAGGLILGGLIFGAGMAILGYCPGTLAISLGQGSVDALIGILGGLAGGIIYTLFLPSIEPVLGANLGAVSLRSMITSKPLFFGVTILIGIVFMVIAFWLHQIDKDKNRKWIVSGIALALLNAIVFSSFITDRPIGASTTFPYAGDLIFNLTHNEYFDKIKVPGNWELIFLAGAFIAGLAISLIKKDFRITLLHSNWKRFKGISAGNRVFWSFTGGFILIMGARMAGGCTSGHILSGGMQLAMSSLTFAVFVFIGLFATGRVFYRLSKA